MRFNVEMIEFYYSHKKKSYSSRCILTWPPLSVHAMYVYILDLKMYIKVRTIHRRQT